jgi:hypothetical protein
MSPWNGGQSMLDTCQGMAGDDDDDEHMSRNIVGERWTLILGTMGTTLANDGSMPNIEGTT